MNNNNNNNDLRLREDDLRQRESELFRRKRLRWLREDEERERRALFYERHRWLIRISGALGVTAILVMGAAAGWVIGNELARPRAISVIVTGPESK